MKRCRNTKLIFISLILLLSTLLFRNLVEPFDVLVLSPTQAAQVLGDAANAAHEVSKQAINAAESAQRAYNAALARFQEDSSQANGVALSNEDSSQANGVALSNAKAQNDAAQQAASDAELAAAAADSAAANAAASIPVSTPPPPTVSAEIQSSLMFAENPVDAIANSTKYMISIACAVVIVYLLYLVLFR